MTVGGYVMFCILALIILVCAVGLGAGFVIDENVTVGIVLIIAGVVATAALWFGMRWWFQNTESGKRAVKTQESNFEGGINRSVKVYDAVGNLLQEYEGRFDVDFNGDEQRILFDDENEKRHVIYFKTGTVIVEEVA